MATPVGRGFHARAAGAIWRVIYPVIGARACNQNVTARPENKTARRSGVPTLAESRKWVQIGCILMKYLDTTIKTHPNDFNYLGLQGQSRLRHHNDGRRRNLKRLRLFCFGRVRMGRNDTEIRWSWIPSMTGTIRLF